MTRKSIVSFTSKMYITCQYVGLFYLEVLLQGPPIQNQGLSFVSFLPSCSFHTILKSFLLQRKKKEQQPAVVIYTCKIWSVFDVLFDISYTGTRLFTLPPPFFIGVLLLRDQFFFLYMFLHLCLSQIVRSPVLLVLNKRCLYLYKSKIKLLQKFRPILVSFRKRKFIRDATGNCDCYINKKSVFFIYTLEITWELMRM